VRLWAEPGRALVASGTSLVVQVQLRRGNQLFINDGIYGSLSDAGVPGFRFPARLVRPDAVSEAPPQGFELFGPTCDSADHMRGPFVLPEDVREGDWIELGQLGAYGGCLRTAFNGFDRARLIEVADRPPLETAGLTVDGCRDRGHTGRLFGDIVDTCCWHYRPCDGGESAVAGEVRCGSAPGVRHAV
jgi:ornithine decarboxylase